jgi:hypothetical protein
MFQQPSQGDKVNVSELLGCLVLIWVREVREGITTPYGEKEAVACDIHVLDGAKGGETFENSLIFQAALIGSLRYAAGGEPVLGRFGQGFAKPGQSAPYILEPFTDADAAIATHYISQLGKPFQPPANGSSPAPAAAAVKTPAAAPVPLDISALDPAVIELLRSTGAIPA